MNNRDFALTYALKAQTPMIHFQAGQQGATLRATEVKPKLDKFIIQKLGVNNIPQSWFLPETNALNYKLRFLATGKSEIGEPFKIYFGNSGKKPGDRNYTWTIKGDCTMQVLCFIPELRDQIDTLVGEFFICTNFGRMQNKGFGSFTVADRPYDKKTIGKMLCESTGAKVCYTFRSSNTDSHTFDDIQRLYSVMKAGFNRTTHHNPRPEQYHRSYLFEYFHGIGNEKAAMKINGVSPAVQHPDNKRPVAEQDFEVYHYVRALLGIADHAEYITAFEPVKRKETILISSDKVSRFASPIFFKVIDGNVYIAANRINKDILGKEFLFTNKTTGKKITLTVPLVFDIDGFMAWFVDRYNRDTRNIPFDARNSYSIKKPINIAYAR